MLLNKQKIVEGRTYYNVCIVVENFKLYPNLYYTSIEARKAVVTNCKDEFSSSTS